MRAFLTIEYGEARGEIRRLDRRAVTAGRDLSCAVWLPDDSIRPRHAEFFVRDGRWFVRTMEASAPIRVNDLPTSESALDDGDRILLGDVEVRFRLRGGLPRAGWVAFAVAVVALAAGTALWRGRTNPDAPAAPDAPEADRSVTAHPETPPDRAGMTELSRRLEEALTNRVERLETERPSPTTALPAAPPLPAEPELPHGQAEAHAELAQALTEARAMAARGDAGAARARVRALLQAYPDSLPVHAEWALQEEAAGNLTEAETAWKEVLAKAVQGPWYDRAAHELSRLTLLQIRGAPPSVPRVSPDLPDFNRGLPAAFRPGVTLPSILGPAPFAPIVPLPAPALPPPALPPLLPVAPVTPRPPEGPVAVRPVPGGPTDAPPLTVRPTPRPTPDPTPAARPRPVVRIGSVQLRRMPPGPDAEDTRLLDVHLEQTPGAEWIRPEKIIVEAVFFDAPPGGAPRPTQALTGPSRVTLDARAWKTTTASASFSYSIPRGSTAGPFHGYRIRVYYDGQPQDAQAKPEALGP